MFFRFIDGSLLSDDPIEPHIQRNRKWLICSLKKLFYQVQKWSGGHLFIKDAHRDNIKYSDGKLMLIDFGCLTTRQVDIHDFLRSINLDYEDLGLELERFLDESNGTIIDEILTEVNSILQHEVAQFDEQVTSSGVTLPNLSVQAPSQTQTAQTSTPRIIKFPSNVVPSTKLAPLNNNKTKTNTDSNHNDIKAKTKYSKHEIDSFNDRSEPFPELPTNKLPASFPACDVDCKSKLEQWLSSQPKKWYSTLTFKKALPLNTLCTSCTKKCGKLLKAMSMKEKVKRPQNYDFYEIENT